MPRIEKSLTNLAQARYITSMDVLKGFHQIKVSPDSRKFLRIICHKGVYEYLRMPFGIKNAPSYFQSMMDSEFRNELTENWLLIYIDDIIIFSETWEEHVDHISRVLKRVKDMGMTISLKKCHFGYQEIAALGKIVSGLRIAVDQNKVAAVMLKPIPQNKQELQSFLGFASYYRSHLKNFAAIASPLYKLCGNDAVFEMTTERVEAWKRLKDMLTSAPFLIHPDYNKPFKLYIDASFGGLGAALHQEQIIDDIPQERPICFISRQLKPSEGRYGASQLECLGLVRALENPTTSWMGPILTG